MDNQNSTAIFSSGFVEDTSSQTRDMRGFGGTSIAGQSLKATKLTASVFIRSWLVDLVTRFEAMVLDPLRSLLDFGIPFVQLRLNDERVVNDLKLDCDVKHRQHGWKWMSTYR